MAKFKKYEGASDYSLQIKLEDYLSTDHLCKQIERIVMDLDTSSIEANYSNRGQNAFHPKMLLSIIFYGYATGIRSGRKLSTACLESLPFIYLSRGYQVSKSVINDFRKLNYNHFSNLFEQVLQRCILENMADSSLSIVDGSKIGANSSKKRTKNKEQYEQWQQFLEQDLQSLAEQAGAEQAVKKKLSY